MYYDDEQRFQVFMFLVAATVYIAGNALFTQLIYMSVDTTVLAAILVAWLLFPFLLLGSFIVIGTVAIIFATILALLYVGLENIVKHIKDTWMLHN